MYYYRVTFKSFACKGVVERVKRWFLDERRAEEVGSSLSRAKDLVDRCEESDPQMRYVGEIVSSLGLVRGAIYVVGVSLISYMLSTRGEEHWRLAAEYAGKGYKNPLIAFVEESPSTARFRATKLRRARKYVELFAPQFEARFDEYAGDLEKFWRDLSIVLSVKPESKTIVFAVKMFYYALKSARKRCRVPRSAPIPVDYRVCMISLTSQIIRGRIDSLGSAARRLRGEAPDLVRKGWDAVSVAAGLEPLRLDSLLWLLGGAVETANYELTRTLRTFEEVIDRPLSQWERQAVFELLRLLANGY